VQVYEYPADATQAVLSGRAYATLGKHDHRVRRLEEPNSSCRPRAQGHARALGGAVPKNNPKLRAELQDALDCMKKDGTIASFREVVRPQAAGGRPRGGDHAGLRPARYAGYDPTPHELHCS